MKVLKIWSFVMLIAGISVYFYGAITGVFNRMPFFWLFYGTSTFAHSLLIISIFCILLSISLFFVIYAIDEKRKR